MEVKTVGVYGAGLMGRGIAQVALEGGYDVVLYNHRTPTLEKGVAGIKKGFEKKVAKGKITQEQADGWLGHLKATIELEDLKDVDIVFEAMVENMALKKEAFAKMAPIIKPEAIFVSNTSSLSITELAAASQRPEKFLGMHFFSPVPAMKLVEVIAGGNTPADLVDYIKNLSVEIGKTPVVVNEAPGFVVNKILIPYCNEGVCVLQEGVASAEDIDIAMQLGCNHPMGPLHLGDLIGWDVVLNIMDVLFNETHDSKYRANVMIRKMVRAGKLGMKSGEGIFNYKK